MRDLFTIFRKEVLDTLRDRRSLTVTVIMPLLVFPILMFVIGEVSKSNMENEMDKDLKIGFVNNGDDLGLRKMIEATPMFKFELIEMADTTQLKTLIPDSLDAGFYTVNGFADQVHGLESGALYLFYDGTESTAGDRLEGALNLFQGRQLSKRLDSLQLSQANIRPVDIHKVNVATSQEMFGKLAGGFLPYIIISFSFLGCMYTAIDMFAGEKERGSFETILTVPVARWKILVGKMAVIVSMGMLSTILAFVGIFVGINISGALPPMMLEVIDSVLTPGFILALMGMLFLLTVFFAGLMTPVSLFARNFKEAQSILTPMNIFVVMPAMIGAFPGMELTTTTAVIPILNIVLSTKDLLAGTVKPGLMVLVVLSLLILALISIYVSFRRFGNEKNILRS